MNKERIQQYYRIHEPYGFYIFENIALPFNRVYSKIGISESYKFDYSLIKNIPCKTIYLYSDNCKPWEGKKNLEMYKKKLKEIIDFYKVENY